MVCKQTLTNTNSSAIFDPDFKRIGGDGGNEVTLPQHVWTDSSCSSNALCPLGESRACQQDGYIKKKLQKRKKKGSDSNLILKRLKKKKKKELLYNKLWKNSSVSVKGWLPQAQLRGVSCSASTGGRGRRGRLGWGSGALVRVEGDGSQGERVAETVIWRTGHHVASILEELVLPRW